MHSDSINLLQCDNPALQFPKVRRIAAFKDFMRRHPCSLDKVVQMDTRDAVFMSDPFDNIVRGLYVSEEVYTLRSEQKYTGRWLDDIKDPTDEMRSRTINQIPQTGAPARRPVLCSGIVAGDSAAFETWLDSMLTLVLRSKLLPGMEFHDQAFHNLIFYRCKDLDIAVQPRTRISNPLLLTPPPIGIASLASASKRATHATLPIHHGAVTPDYTVWLAPSQTRRSCIRT